MHSLLVEVEKRWVRGEYAAGEDGLTPPSRLGQMPFTLPRDAPVCFAGSSTGRPVVRSTAFAQLTGANAAAMSSRPVARSSVYAKPFLSKCTSALVRFPATVRSARIIAPAAS